MGSNVEEYWQRLQCGVCGIKKKTYCFSWGERSFYAGFITHPLLSENIEDRFFLSKATQLLLIACKEAITCAYGYIPLQMDMDIIIGTALGGMDLLEQEFLQAKGKQSPKLSFYMDQPAKTIKRVWNVKGETLTVSTACTSSQNAIGIAYHKIAYGGKKRILVGGTDVVSHFILNGLRTVGALTDTKMQPFDFNRNGMSIGEGAGSIILEDLGSALERNAVILGEIEDYISLSEAYHLMRPEAQGHIILQSLNKLNFHEYDKAALYASGNGTHLNDKGLAHAIQEKFGHNMPCISCIKAHIGHTLGASGIIEGIAMCLALNRNRLLPIYGLKKNEFHLKYSQFVRKYEYDHYIHLSTSFGGNVVLIHYKKWKE